VRREPCRSAGGQAKAARCFSRRQGGLVLRRWLQACPAPSGATAPSPPRAHLGAHDQTEYLSRALPCCSLSACASRGGGGVRTKRGVCDQERSHVPKRLAIVTACCTVDDHSVQPARPVKTQLTCCSDPHHARTRERATSGTGAQAYGACDSQTRRSRSWCCPTCQ
jgi:hypothetical protein